MNNIAKETKQINNLSVYTDKGWIPIQYIHKTTPFRKYIVLFDSGREIECADTHCFIDVNDIEILAMDLREGDKLSSVDGYDTVFDVFDTKCYEEMYDITLPEHNLYYSNNILSHNSNIMANIISRQVMHGHNVCLCTLEMSEDMFAQRFDAIYSMLDINRIYINKKFQREMINTLRMLKESEDRGNLFIKAYPTGAASTKDFRMWLRELTMRDMAPEILYCDYINLMSPENKSKDNMYSDIKKISEELRAIGFEFNIPVVSVSQLNRSGTFLSFEEVDMNSIAESMGIPATADFMAIMGGDESSMVYESEVAYKIVKNRLGGQIGAIDKLYFDDRSLKMYDSTELDVWIEDSKRTEGSRNLFEHT